MAVMIAVVEHRVRVDRALHGTPALLAILLRRIARLHAHGRDARGRNWDVPALDVTTAWCHGDETDFRRLVDAMRDQFDLA